MAAVAGAAAVATGVTWLVWPSSAAERFDLTGALELHGKTLHDGSGLCMGQGGYSDIAESAPVSVYDGTGSVIGTGRLARGDDHGWTPNDSTERSNQCWFAFTVSVPGSDFYQVEVSHRGKLTVSQSDARSGKVELALGG